MIVELQRFIDFKHEWFGADVKTKAMLSFEAMTINTDYIAWVQRQDLGPVEMCAIHMADRGGTYRFDISYRKACALMRGRRKAA